MAKKGRAPRVTPYADNFINSLMRRENMQSDDAAIRRMQRLIRNKTSDINEQEMRNRDNIIRQLEQAIANSTDYSAQVNMQTALDDYRAGHIDNGVHLSDVSGKVRTLDEAQEIMERLYNQTAKARDTRMRKNYDNALRAKGYEALADWLLGLSDEAFLLAYYAQPNAKIGFEYHTTGEEYSTLEESWKNTVKQLGKKARSDTRARNRDRLVDEAWLDIQ